MTIERKKTYSKCKVIFNDKELNNCKITGTQNLFDGKYLVKIIRPSKKSRKKKILFEKEDYVKSLNNFQGKHPDISIIPLFQFLDGYIISKNNYNLILDIQLTSKLKSVVFIERNRKQSVKNFKKDFQKFLLDPRNEDKDIFLFIQTNSKKLRLKLDFAFDNGIKNFIIRGGKYKDIRFWVGIISKIHSINGKVFCSLPKRYNNKNISYIKPLVDYGADYVFHQAFNRPPPKDIEEDNKDNILYLGKNFKYFKTLNKENVKEYLDKNLLKDLDKILSKNKDNEYELSRVISLKTTPKLIRLVVIYEILDTS